MTVTNIGDGMRAAMPVDSLLSLILYKQWADRELLNALQRLPWLARWTIGRIALKIVRHFHTVDCIFRAHLLGIGHSFTSANPAEPRTLVELGKHVTTTDQWYVDYARGLDVRRAAEALSVTFTDGDRQRLTRSEMLLHVVLHGAYHRGNVGILLRLCGVTLPDRLTSYLRGTEAISAAAA